MTVAGEVRTDEWIRALWAQILPDPPTSVDEDFFDLGGQSLHLVQVTAAIRDEYGVDLPLGELFADDLTVRAMATVVDRIRDGAGTTGTASAS